MIDKPNELEDDFWKGFALALADINRLHDQPTMVKNVIEGHGITLAQLRRAGAAEYDLLEISKCVGPEKLSLNAAERVRMIK